MGLAPRARERHGFVIRVRPGAGRLARERMLLVGDAAGLADPVTAEGISPAARSGGLAAGAIIASELDPPPPPARHHPALPPPPAELRVAPAPAPLLSEHPPAPRRMVPRPGPPPAQASPHALLDV